jgi:choline-sulfatase
VESIGKLHFRAVADPTGFAEQQLPMHVVGGAGDLLGSLRDGSAVLAKYRGHHENAGVGESTYSAYDREITAATVDWLANQALRFQDKPWVLFASLVCPHPPLIAPEDFYQLYPPEEMPWPVDHDPDKRPEHPAMADLRRFMGIDEPFSEDVVRRSISAYFGLCSFLDHNLGQILGALEASGLAETTRVIYSSDHGEANGNQGLLGKCNLYEGAIGVPLLMAGPGVPAGRVVAETVSHVDLFPTLVEGAGGQLLDQDADLPGRSLWPAIAGGARAGAVFAEYHAAGSRTGSFMVRDGHMKLIYYMNMPPQFFDLATDLEETHDLAQDPTQREALARLEGLLRAICDPEAVDSRAKADQRAKMDHWGGPEAIKAEGMLVYTPPPGAVPDIQGRAGEP